jgi:hypothetical protein
MTAAMMARSNVDMRPAITECVADILERKLGAEIDDGLALVEKPEDLVQIPLRYEDRSGHWA